MGASFGAELEKLRAERQRGAAWIARGRCYEMQRHGAAPNAALLTALTRRQEPGGSRRRGLRRRRAGRRGEGRRRRGTEGSRSPSSAAARRKRSMRMGQSPDKPSLAPVADIYALLERRRSVRPLGGPHRDRAHGARRVEGSRAQGNQSARRARGHGRLRQDRAAARACSRLIDKQLGMLKQTNLSVENKLRLYRALMYTTTEIKGGLTRGAAAAAQRPGRRRSSRPQTSASTASSRCCSATPVSPRRSPRSSPRCRRATTSRSCSCTISTRCA